MLSVTDLHVNYGRAEILHGVSLDVGEKPVSVVGRNGMGKTTFCYAIMGMIPVRSGAVVLDNVPLHRRSAMQIARRGIAIVPQGRRVFPSLSVDEHLKLASRGRKAAWTPERIYDTFPRLAERKSNGGAQLSGGEQQMLAIARALLRNPRLVIMDEPSEGLAPVIVDQLIDVLKRLSLDKIGLLLIEQNLRVATSVSDTVAVMIGGRIAATLPAARLNADETLQRRYLGVVRLCIDVAREVVEHGCDMDKHRAYCSNTRAPICDWTKTR